MRRQLNCKTDPSMTQEKKDYPNETAPMRFSIRSYVEETVLSFSPMPNTCGGGPGYLAVNLFSRVQIGR